MEAAAHGHSTLGIPKKVGEEYVAADASAGIAAGIVFVAPDGEILLLRRAGEQSKDNFVDHWALPGGGADAGETPEQCADREAAEELGNMAPVGPKRLLDKRSTPNGMIFHTFAQAVDEKFWPKLNEEHSAAGWFRLNDLPRPMHPAVRTCLSNALDLGIAEDMAPEDWAVLRNNFAKWTREEEAEAEHAADNQPMLATTANTGMPAFIKKWNKKAKDEAARAKDPNVCPTCGGTGELAGPGMACDHCGGTGKLTGGECAFDMARFMRGLGADEGFNEEDHPRAPDGKFGSGSGSSKSSKYKTAGKPSWNGGTHDDPAKMETGTLESNARALKYAIKSSPFTHEQRAKREERLADIDAELKERASGGPAKAKGALKMSALTKKGGKLGSNEGGLYEGEAGAKYYIKKPGSKAHVQNERTAAALYQLAGAKTLDYRDVEGGEHVATEWKKLEKKNIAEFTPAERKEAAKDFAIHAWLSNWDAAGTGGDNQGVLGGKTTTLDVGGSLRFRAQGGPKGGAFGDKVTEWDSMRNKGMSPDAARLFAPMSESELRASVERVAAIPDAKIRAAVGDDKELADRLIARKKDLAGKVGLAMDSKFSCERHRCDVGYVCSACETERRALAQDSRKEPEHTLIVRYDGDFSFKGLLGHLARLGSIGASRTIEARDEDDKIVPFGWDGDGADKIWAAELDGEQLAFDRVMVMGIVREGLAFDRAPDSVRTTDADGRMHVEVSNISKAVVNPYLGKEIPKYKELGLEADKVYQLLRDPEELKKGAATFNNLPLLDEHVGVNAADHKPQHVIGSTGTDSVFEHPHLKNSLVVWANRGIKAIESKKKKELSSAYRYRADMTPGNYEGVRYDGVMRDIVGNHVALVEEGRAGSDVVVGDSANPLTRRTTMQKNKLSALGTVAYGALMTFLRPQLAQDAKLDLTRGLRGITAKNFKAKRPTLAAWVAESVKDKLDPQFAQDGALNADGLEAVFDMVELALDDFPDDMEKKKDDDKKGKDMKPAAGAKDEDSDEDADMENADDEAETDEEKAARMKKRADDKKAKDKKAKDKKAKDADVNEEDEDHDPKTPEKMGDDEDMEERERAMDEQIQSGIEAGIKRERARMEAVTAAKEHVRPRVGNLVMAFDSAADVYRKALTIATGKEPPKKADADTLRYAFDQLPAKDGQQRRTYAMDSATNTAGGDIAKRNPTLSKNMERIGRV